MDWTVVLKDIKHGKICALYLPTQNVSFIVSIPVDVHSTVAMLPVFRVATKSSKVMVACAFLSGIFQSWSVTTHVNRVQNASLARHVANLANHTFEGMVPKLRKPGFLHAEERIRGNW